MAAMGEKTTKIKKEFTEIKYEVSHIQLIRIMQNEIRGFNKNAFKKKVDSFNSDHKVNN